MMILFVPGFSLMFGNVLRLAAVRFPAFDRRTTVSVHCVSVHEGRSALQQALLLATVNYYI